MNGIRQPDKQAGWPAAPAADRNQDRSDEKNVPHLFLVRNMFFCAWGYWPYLTPSVLSSRLKCPNFKRNFAVAVEDHPLWPKWKAAFEDMVKHKEIYDNACHQHGEDSAPARNAKGHYGLALHRYHLIANEV